MAHTYEFVIAAVKDDDRSVGSDGLCPRLPEGWHVSITSIGLALLHQALGSKIMTTFVGFVIVVLFAFALPVFR
jgi:hypothetical protein